MLNDSLEECLKFADEQPTHFDPRITAVEGTVASARLAAEVRRLTILLHCATEFRVGDALIARRVVNPFLEHVWKVISEDDLELAVCLTIEDAFDAAKEIEENWSHR